MEYTCGALLSPDDENDTFIEDLAGFSEDSVLPEEFHCVINTKVRDQGRRETCAAHSACSILEFLAQDGKHRSVEYVYDKRVNKPTPGMYGRDVMNIIKNHGSVLEEDCPYGSTVIEPVQGEKLKVKSYSRINSIQALKYALIHNGPCFVVLPYKSSSVKFWKSSFKTRDHVLGLHAVVITGYNTKGFIIRNSWGDSWANSGHTAIDFNDFNLIKEIWTAF